MNPTKCTTCGQAPGFCSEHRRPVVSESVDSLCAACESEAHGRLIAFIKEAESNAVQEYIDSMGGVL